MTTAVCIHCGELKFGSFVPCHACNGRPKTDHELIISLAMSDHYLDLETLQQIGSSIKERGEPPNLDPDSYESFRKILEEFRASGTWARLFGDIGNSNE
jgi:hypothetical protein